MGETNGDPRERGYPDVLRVTVETDETKPETHGMSEDTSIATSVSFSSIAELRDVLSDRRIEVLRALMDAPDPHESLDAIADDLDVDRQTIRDDLTLLEEHGIVVAAVEGESKQPVLPYTRIHIDVEIASSVEPMEPDRQGEQRGSQTITDSEIDALREDIRCQDGSTANDDGSDADTLSWLDE
jgi:predicted transcriptional regulator